MAWFQKSETPLEVDADGGDALKADLAAAVA